MSRLRSRGGTASILQLRLCWKKSLLGFLARYRLIVTILLSLVGFSAPGQEPSRTDLAATCSASVVLFVDESGSMFLSQGGAAGPQAPPTPRPIDQVKDAITKLLFEERLPMGVKAVTLKIIPFAGELREELVLEIAQENSASKREAKEKVDAFLRSLEEPERRRLPGSKRTDLIKVLEHLDSAELAIASGPTRRMYILASDFQQDQLDPADKRASAKEYWEHSFEKIQRSISDRLRPPLPDETSPQVRRPIDTFVLLSFQSAKVTNQAVPVGEDLRRILPGENTASYSGAEVSAEELNDDLRSLLRPLQIRPSTARTSGFHDLIVENSWCECLELERLNYSSDILKKADSEGSERDYRLPDGGLRLEPRVPKTLSVPLNDEAWRRSSTDELDSQLGVVDVKAFARRCDDTTDSEAEAGKSRLNIGSYFSISTARATLVGAKFSVEVVARTNLFPLSDSSEVRIGLSDSSDLGHEETPLLLCAEEQAKAEATRCLIVSDERSGAVKLSASNLLVPEDKQFNRRGVCKQKLPMGNLIVDFLGLPEVQVIGRRDVPLTLDMNRNGGSADPVADFWESATYTIVVALIILGIIHCFFYKWISSSLESLGDQVGVFVLVGGVALTVLRLETSVGPGAVDWLEVNGKMASIVILLVVAMFWLFYLQPVLLRSSLGASTTRIRWARGFRAEDKKRGRRRALALTVGLLIFATLGCAVIKWPAPPTTCEYVFPATGFEPP